MSQFPESESLPAQQSQPPQLPEAEAAGEDRSAEAAGPAQPPAAEPEPHPQQQPPAAEGPRIQEQRKFPPPTGQKRWYVVKVQTNREDTVKEAILRRVKMQGLEDLFGEILVPTETTVEYKGGKKRYKKQKLYPGYLIINMEVTDESWFLVRETPGVGDFTGAAGHPVPMDEEEIEQLLARIRPHQREEEKAKQVIDVKVGDRVKIKEGTFFNFEGEVEAVDETTGRVTVMINIFGRSTPVEMKHYQLEVL